MVPSENILECFYHFISYNQIVPVRRIFSLWLTILKYFEFAFFSWGGRLLLLPSLVSALDLAIHSATKIGRVFGFSQ